MDEQTTATGEIKGGTVVNLDDGNKPEVISPIERAERTLERLDETEKRIDEKLKKLNEAEANRLIAGTAGGHIETPTLEQQKAREAQKMADEISGAFR